MEIAKLIGGMLWRVNRRCALGFNSEKKTVDYIKLIGNVIVSFSGLILKIADLLIKESECHTHISAPNKDFTNFEIVQKRYVNFWIYCWEN